MLDDLLTEVISFSENSNVDVDPDPNIDLRMLTQSNGNVLGDVRSAVLGQSLTITGPSSNGFIVEATSVEASLQRTVNSGPPTMGGASARFEINFEIQAGEAGTLDLNFDYNLQNLGVSAGGELVWSLTGPAGQDLSAFAGTITVGNGASASDTVSESSSALLSGSYSFAISSVIPVVDAQNIQSAQITVQDFSLAFTAIPEPSSAVLFGLGILLLGSFRHRS